ncbi:molybdopterin-dependent oxidoreductase [Streptomyces sp. H27-D2]|nr:molybdopterin-dependent oxidoreductase [Streptomyces sp. H27-D2]MEC4018727.1 molybdopterin-dependent oxidoreductase [Streptomyces sp. H27-D2]
MSKDREATTESAAPGSTPGRRRTSVRLLRGALGALSGLLAGFAALASAELVSAAVRPESSPITAVGGAVIDRTPVELKDYAVRTFGNNDKLVLQLGILAVLALFAMFIGVLAALAPRFRRTCSAGVLLFGLVGALAAASRPDSGGADWVPSAVGAVGAAGVLYLLAGRLAWSAQAEAPEADEARAPGPNPDPSTGPTPSTAPAPSTEPAAGRPLAADSEHSPGAPFMRPDGEPAAPRPAAGAFDRRGFVIAATAAAAASAGAGVLGRRLNASSGAEAAASRKAVTLPAPDSRAAAIPRGSDLKTAGVSSFTTSNHDFYRVDTALVVPRVDATGWKLRIHGKGVPRDVSVNFQDLLRRELIERDITLTCVSNQVGGPYVGTARWIGVRLADLLREAGVKPPSKGGKADQLVARSVDGMTIGTPVEAVMDGRDAMLAVGMNGEPLPFSHGFPVRMLVPGLYGYVSACKWLRDLELTTFDSYDPYWVKRSWAKEAPIKTQSRIDTPKPFSTPKAGSVPVGGVAWAQHKGIDRVEVRVDGGAWHTARLADEATTDTWRQWVWDWPATAGSHNLEVRATDREGYTQTDKRVGTVPDGATGWHSVVVDVT